MPAIRPRALPNAALIHIEANGVGKDTWVLGLGTPALLLVDAGLAAAGALLSGVHDVERDEAEASKYRRDCGQRLVLGFVRAVVIG